MTTAVKIIAQHYEVESGKILQETTLRSDQVIEPKELKELGYLHLEQMDLLSKCQEFRISQQIKLINDSSDCPKCGNRAHKKGQYTSKFHGMFSDHFVTIKRIYCTCGCDLPYTIEGLFGNTTHPELLKKQAMMAADKSFVKVSKDLNYDSEKDRSVNNRTNINRVAIKVGEILENVKSEKIEISDPGVTELVAHIDGGHVKKRGEGRSFEAMIATVYQPSNVSYIDKNHNEILSKHIVSSARDDGQESIKKQFRNACINEGMGEETHLICLADGADNCWSIAESIASDCRKITYILDWFHIGMKFKNNSSVIPEELKESYDKVKWNLWHGNADKALVRLDNIIADIDDETALNKLSKLRNYIYNNTGKIINYEIRKKNGLVFSSSYAESTVNNLINTRQKNKQRMTWTREGAHNILQIRASVMSNTWDNDWKQVEKAIYYKAA